MGMSGGGVFLPNDPPPSTGQVLTNPTISGATLTGTFTGGTFTGQTVTSTGATLTAPVISGAATVASGATLTTPSVLITTAAVTATGTGSGDAATVTAVTPQYVSITGATGSGVGLPTGPQGLAYWLGNESAATMRIYCVGGTINGTTGTTAYTITNTGNKLASAFCTSATGAWFIHGNT